MKMVTTRTATTNTAGLKAVMKRAEHLARLSYSSRSQVPNMIPPPVFTPPFNFDDLASRLTEGIEPGNIRLGDVREGYPNDITSRDYWERLEVAVQDLRKVRFLNDSIPHFASVEDQLIRPLHLRFIYENDKCVIAQEEESSIQSERITRRITSLFRITQMPDELPRASSVGRRHLEINLVRKDLHDVLIDLLDDNIKKDLILSILSEESEKSYWAEANRFRAVIFPEPIPKKINPYYWECDGLSWTLRVYLQR